MATNVRDTLKGLSPARRKKIDARASALIAEEMSLRDLRQALALARTAFRISKNAAICCCPLCGPTSKPWAVSSH